MILTGCGQGASEVRRDDRSRKNGKTTDSRWQQNALRYLPTPLPACIALLYTVSFLDRVEFGYRFSPIFHHVP